MNYLITFTVLLSTTLANAQSVFLLSEQRLAELVKNNPPSVEDLKIAVLGVQKTHAQFNEGFAHRLTAGYNYTKSNEESLMAFKPVMTPVENMNLVYSKNFKNGMGVSTTLYTNKSSTANGALTDGITSGVSARLTIDLHKNLWGKITKSNDAILDLSHKKAELQKLIQTKVFLTSLRKIYWALVANSESLKITTHLHKTAQDQLKDAKKRLKSRVTDIGEVARYQSQVAARKASLLYLNYQKELLVQQLKTLLPEIAVRKVVLAPYQMDKIVTQVLSCTKKLSSIYSVPLNFTSFDELLGLSKQIFNKEKKITNRYNKADVKFFIEAKEQAIKTGAYSDAVSDFWDDKKEGVAFGLTVDFSLGGAQAKTKSLQDEIEKRRYIREQEDTLGKMSTYHSQIIKSIMILNSVVEQLQKNSSYLEKSLQEVKRKYDQARISYRDFINEQNLLLESNLNEIKTKLEIINTLFDYFSVFTETDCEINK